MLLLYLIQIIVIRFCMEFQNIKKIDSIVRVVCFVPKFDHITPTLVSAHWLPVKYRVIF